MAEILWVPSEEGIQNSNLTHFTAWLSSHLGYSFSTYQALQKWSVDHLESFWKKYLSYAEIRHSSPATQVLDTHKMPGARWFSGMQLNYAENILGRDFEGDALLFAVEADRVEAGSTLPEVRRYSWQDLRIAVSRCARGLRKAGLNRGDRVAGVVANVPEAVIAGLACASLGVTWSSTSPDFGPRALVDRLSQVQPQLLFASTHYRYGGKLFQTDQTLAKLKQVVPSIRKIVALPYAEHQGGFRGDESWEDFLGAEDAPPLFFEQVSFDHPLYILFSSGTTGKPKCLVHGTGGTLLQHMKELHLHCDIRRRDRLLFFTTCGWMMWNWQLSALALGATIVLYDGNPGYPDLYSIWHWMKGLAVTHFGTSGRYIEACMKHKEPLRLGELPDLRCVLYTGSPLSEDGFRWVYANIKRDLHLAGISGGTDIVSCFVLGNPNLPVRAGEIQCKGLGIDVEAVDEKGVSVGTLPGELVCRSPIPSMPVGFLNDETGEIYRRSYFDHFPGVWWHGDYVQFTPSGGVIIYGRSDATLNPGGVRIGSSEIYGSISQISWIKGAVVVGWTPPTQSDEVIVLCLVLPEGEGLSEERKKEVQSTIRAQCSPKHVPQHIYQVSEIPITRSGKTVELSVKSVLNRKTVSNREALANPQILDEFETIRKDLEKTYDSAADES